MRLCLRRSPSATRWRHQLFANRRSETHTGRQLHISSAHTQKCFPLVRAMDAKRIRPAAQHKAMGFSAWNVTTYWGVLSAEAEAAMETMETPLSTQSSHSARGIPSHGSRSKETLRDQPFMSPTTLLKGYLLHFIQILLTFRIARYWLQSVWMQY